MQLDAFVKRVMEFCVMKVCDLRTFLNRNCLADKNDSARCS